MYYINALRVEKYIHLIDKSIFDCMTEMFYRK